MSGRVRTAADLRESVVEVCDVCIVGSGAGGAVLAAGLCERGLSVVMLEEGGNFSRRDFDLREGNAYPRMYQERGTRATADLAITILQGRTVGGSTTINWTTCFRTPERILSLWKERFGVEGLGAADLAPHFDEVERRLEISTWPLERANENNRQLLEGAKRLGWQFNPLARNVRGCADTGYCGVGCPIDAKRAMHVTYLPDAVAAGLRLYADARAERLERRGDRIVAVHARVLDPATQRPSGRTIEVRPKVTVLSGGAIGSPALLLRSDLDFNGRTGRRTFLHPVVAMAALYDRPIRAWAGAPQSVGSHQFAERGEGRIGFFLETPPVHPMLAGTALPGFGREQQELLARLPHLGVLIALSIDGILEGDEGGRVSIRSDGRIRVDYPIGDALAESFRASSVAMAKLQFAAGAEEVRSLHFDPVVLRGERDLPLLEKAPWGALRHSIFTAHQMGGCAMGADPKSAVVRSDLRHHHLENLFVVDGSVFPTSLGVNPSETIYALAHHARERIAAAV